MNIVIIEDEAYAARRLENLIKEYNPEFKIVSWLESVHDSIEFVLPVNKKLNNKGGLFRHGIVFDRILD